jgi:16S rRNA G527 N7-methylase RsmG
LPGDESPDVGTGAERETAGVERTAEVERRLARYAEELARWGSRTNLVGSTEPDAIRRSEERRVGKECGS